MHKTAATPSDWQRMDRLDFQLVDSIVELHMVVFNAGVFVTKCLISTLSKTAADQLPDDG